MAGSGLGSGDLLSILHASARNGTLLSSCEPEVKELMHQLDVLLSTKSKEWEREMERVTSLLKMKEVELQQLAAALKAKDAEVENLRHGPDQMYHSAGCTCEAKLIRLRAELTRISENYEQLKQKRYQRDAKSHHRELESEMQMMKLKQEVEKSEQKLGTTREELKRSMKRIVELETTVELLKDENRMKQTVEEKATCYSSGLSHIETSRDADSTLKGGKEIGVSLQVLDQVLDQHFQTLSKKLLKILNP